MAVKTRARVRRLPSFNLQPLANYVHHVLAAIPWCVLSFIWYPVTCGPRGHGSGGGRF